ncbi:MAG: hypothetical protein JW797_01445 [Bradymonadales bacterium]|nr:hypothetical protein [Bradymonadales bacterium]
MRRLLSGHLRLASLSWIVMAPLILFGGCGDDDLDGPMACGAGTYMIGGVCQRIVQCGQGTELINDVCVPTLQCGPGTELVSDRCVPAYNLVCGAGTVLSETGGQCVGATALGPDTTISEGQCVPLYGLICSEGTRLSDSGDRCVGAVSPGPDTIVREGECVPIYQAICGSGTVLAESGDECIGAIALGDDTTVNEYGECVPIYHSICGEGSYLAESGDVCLGEVTCGPDTVVDLDQCVPLYSAICSTGTQLAEVGNRCVSTLTLGPNTTLVNNQCLPTYETICTGDTVFDPLSGTCVPDYSLIGGLGTYYDDDLGQIVPDYELICDAQLLTEYDGSGMCQSTLSCGEGSQQVTVDGEEGSFEMCLGDIYADLTMETFAPRVARQFCEDYLSFCDPEPFYDFFTHQTLATMGMELATETKEVSLLHAILYQNTMSQYETCVNNVTFLLSIMTFETEALTLDETGRMVFDEEMAQLVLDMFLADDAGFVTIPPEFFSNSRGAWDSLLDMWSFYWDFENPAELSKIDYEFWLPFLFSGSREAGELCGSPTSCAEGLVCGRGGIYTYPTCFSPRGEEESCMVETDCAEGLTCRAFESESGPGRCLEPIETSTEPCKRDEECSSALNLSCFADGHCHAIGTSGPAYSCNSTPDCAPTKYCDVQYDDATGGDIGTCTAIYELEDECPLDQTEPCGPEAFCMPAGSMEEGQVGVCTRTVDICIINQVMDLIGTFVAGRM